MSEDSPIVFLSLPGLRQNDLSQMPALRALGQQGGVHELTVGFPAVTWPVEATLLTGVRPNQHGIIANGLFSREQKQVQMWTFGNEAIERPQIWDRMAAANRNLTSAAWFPMLSKRSNANFVCMPAPVHNPDGSESMWCYTQPSDLYRQLLERLGQFPLQHFWGPLANIKSSEWIAKSAVIAAELFKPDFFYIYLPHLDYAAQKTGPDSPAALQAICEFDGLIQSLIAGINSAYARTVTWMAASEYAISATDHVTYPNRLLRERGLLNVKMAADGEHLDWENSLAWALVDHQFSQIFVRDSNPQIIKQVLDLFRKQAGFREVISGAEKASWQIDHPRCGDVVLISETNSWQAYYWWRDVANAPGFSRTVDIHRKPGYDPVELHFDPKTRSIPLDATLVKGSHGTPSDWVTSRPLLLTSESRMFGDGRISDTDIFSAVLKHFGIA